MGQLSHTTATVDQSITNVVQSGAIVSVSASRSAVLTDGYSLLNCNSGSAIAITIPNDSTVAWSGCVVISLYQAGAGAVSFTAGAGVTFRGSAPSASQYKTISMMRVGANEWAYL